MLSNHVFNLYQPVNTDESIVKIESRTYLPFVKSFNHSDVIEITINRTDCWLLMHDAAIIIKGKVQKTKGNGDVKLVQNAGAFLFDSIIYELCGMEIEKVRDPGIISTMRGYLIYEEDDSKLLETGGWNYPKTPTVNTDGSFIFRIPVYHLFNFFKDYQMAMCGKQTFRFFRAQNDHNAIKITSSDPKDHTEAKITIDSMELKVKHIYPNDIIKMDLLNAIRSNKPILMPFRKWEIHELPSLPHGGNKEIWAVKTSTEIECPRFIICGFQTDKKNKSSEDITEFNHINITDIRALLNSDIIPQENLRLNFDKNEYAEAYQNYTQFAQSYGIFKKSPLLTFSEFKEKPVFVLDCSRRDQTFKATTIDVKLEIESSKGFPNNTRVLCIIVHDCIIEFKPLTEEIKKITNF
ncbi:uncharacterized protein LOC123311693 [Coccinella septempunctata]|uniref:uncharacterized protein LOC123311693 n=1 Tax=Coccinella septempunctata TaxID=41139 RepID=UPI001D081353|nr:uncharacterized protein LOC123311693 [Coccinella septempunctata]